MALIVRNLHKHFGTRVALQKVDFTLQNGVVALLGANGSGKSTLLRILATLSKPDAGEVIFDELQYAHHERELRTQIGYLPQDFDIPETLTARKFLRYLANLRGGNPDQVIEALAIKAVANEPVSKLSTGQRRLVGVAQALLGTPRLLLLDELSRTLDYAERERVFRLMTQQDKLIIFSTHIPEDAERIAQTVIVLHQGSVLFCGALDDLRKLATGQVYELCVSQADLPRIVSSLLISRITPQGSQAIIRVVGKPAVGEFSAREPTLEDAYLYLKRRQ